MEDLRRSIETVIPLTEDLWERVEKMAIIREYQKGGCILSSGEICRHSYFLHKGLVKMYYLKEGKEHIGDFFLEGDFFSDHTSFLSQKPSRFYLEAIEPVTVYLIPYHEQYNLWEEQPLMGERFRRIMAETYFVEFADRIWGNLIDSPEEKYIRLQAEKPRWLERIPQYLIASYLGVTPVGLSKIRRRMAERGIY